MRPRHATAATVRRGVEVVYRRNLKLSVTVSPSEIVVVDS